MSKVRKEMHLRRELKNNFHIADFYEIHNY